MFISIGFVMVKFRSLINFKYGIGTVMSEFYATDVSRRKFNMYNDVKIFFVFFNFLCVVFIDYFIEFIVVSVLC